MDDLRRLTIVVLAAAMVLGGSALLLATPTAEAAPQFWNGPDGWSYRAPLFVNYSGASSNLVQVPFSLPTASLIAAGKLRADCADLRIATESGTILPFWIESGCGGTARVWVRVPTLTSGTTRLNVYYGNKSSSDKTDQLNTTFVGNRTWVDMVDCPTAPSSSCLVNNHGTADNYRDLTPSCTVSRLSVDYGVPCGLASSFGTNNQDHFIAEYHFIFVPDVSGTWQFQWISGYSGELVVNPTDDELYHSMTVLGASYTPTNTTQTHTGSRNLTAGVGEFYSFLVSEATGIEGSRIKIQRPGGSFLTLNPTNYDGLYFRRTHPAGPMGAWLGSEEALPSVPTSISVSAGPSPGALSVNWAAPGSGGGSAITGYHVYLASDSGGPYSIAANVSGTSTVLTGLPEGATRYVRVSAYTTNGPGPLSAIASATTWARPSAPASITATYGNGSVSLSWPLPPSDGGTAITNYRIYSGTTTSTTYLAQTNGANRTFVVNGLTNGVTRYFNITAENAVGQGVSSPTASALPGAEPYPPGTPSAGRGDTWVDLWAPAAFANGPAVDNYRVYMGTSPGTATLLAQTGGANASFRVNGLTNGVLYYFHYTAHNAYGWSSASAEISARPARPPDAPTLAPLTIQNGSIALSWSPPGNTGGEPIGYYIIYNGTAPGNAQVYGGIAGTAYTWYGTNGAQLCFQISAVTTAGEGPRSAERCGTPKGVPYPPMLIDAFVGNHSLQPYWSTPFDDNSGLTGYHLWSGTTLLCTRIGANDCTVSGLTNGQPYTYHVTAFNSVGDSSSSNIGTFVPASIPHPPGSLSMAPANHSLMLTWIAPNTEGSALTHYTVWNGTTPIVTIPAPATSATIPSLANGYAYTFNLTATNAIGRSLSSNAATQTPGGIPDPVPSLVATRWNRSVDLTWGIPASHGYPISGYEVLDGTTVIATPTTTSFNHTPITNGVMHVYRIRALNGIGTGNQSAPASATPASIPDPPSLTAERADGSIRLTWDAPYDQGEPITSYRVWNGTTLVSDDPSTVLVLSGLQNGYTYTYNATAINAVGKSVSSATVSAKPAGVPTPIQTLSVTASNRTLSLAWSGATGNGEPITGYKIYRGPAPGATTLLATLGPTTTYVDSALSNGIDYVYNVSAVNVVGPGAAALFVTERPVSLPDPPVLAAAIRGDTIVDLSWASGNAQGAPVCRYDLYRGLASGGARTRIAQLEGGNECTPATSYHDSGLTNGVLYVYNLTATNAVGESNTSNDLTARPAAPPSAPRSPGAGFRNGGADLLWSVPLSTGGEPITGYQVYVRTLNGPFAAHGAVVPGSPTVVDDLVNGVTYRLAVSALNAAGESVLSSEVEVIPTRPPDPPANLLGTPSSHQVRLDWDLPAFDGGRPLTGHRISWSEGPTTLGTVDIGTNRSFVVANLVDGHTYTFKVAARNIAGYGNFTAPLNAMPYGPPTAPTIVSVTQLSTTSSITVDWDAPASDGGRPITQYRLYASDTPAGERSFVATLPATTTIYTDQIPAGASRTYVVMAVNSEGEGAPSPEATGSRLPSPLDPTPDTYRTCTRNANTGATACTQGSQRSVVAVSAGARHTCALLADGRIDCWGDNTAGQAADHVAGRGAVAIATGAAHTCALLDNGAVDCWGANGAGQAVSSLNVNASAVSTGDVHTCILRLDKSVVCQGANSYGESVGRASGVRAISAGGRHTCFLLTNGSLDCQGRNSEGQANDAWTQDILEVSAGGFHTCYRRAGGVTCQGDIGAPPSFSAQVAQLASGRGHTCALLTTGAAVCWGAGRDGQAAGYAGTDATSISAGDTHTCITTFTGTIRCWGATGPTDYGQAQAYPLSQEASGQGPQGNSTIHVEVPDTRALTITRKENE